MSIFDRLYCLIKIKRKREQITSLTFLRYRQTPNNLKRVKAHAIRREPSTFVLDCFCQILPILVNKNQSGRFTICLLYLYRYVTIRSFVLGFYIIC